MSSRDTSTREGYSKKGRGNCGVVGKGNVPFVSEEAGSLKGCRVVDGQQGGWRRNVVFEPIGDTSPSTSPQQHPQTRVGSSTLPEPLPSSSLIMMESFVLRIRSCSICTLRSTSFEAMVRKRSSMPSSSFAETSEIPISFHTGSWGTFEADALASSLLLRRRLVDRLRLNPLSPPSVEDAGSSFLPVDGGAGRFPMSMRLDCGAEESSPGAGASCIHFEI